MSTSKQKESAFNSQVGGTHYTDMKIDPITFALENDLDFFQKDIIKYVVRRKPGLPSESPKDARLRDLRKGLHYLLMYIEAVEQDKIL